MWEKLIEVMACIPHSLFWLLFSAWNIIRKISTKSCMEFKNIIFENNVKLLTTMPKGATNTHKEKIRQIHPTTCPRMAPLNRNWVTTIIAPNPPTTNKESIFIVWTCVKLIINIRIFF